MSNPAGRACPVRYRYGAEAIAGAPVVEIETLYVVGGLYGNLPALDTIEAMAASERGPVTLIFNGDFNWFNVDDHGFAEINRRVLRHQAIVGNVEAELGVDGAEAGCGCAYPEDVEQAMVERSNQIHARLKATAVRQPGVLAQLAALPMFARYLVCNCRIGVVHGDADSLAGWRFDVAALDNTNNQEWVADAFRRSAVDLFTSSHTCLPALRQFSFDQRAGVVINNGAAGMPNFKGKCSGLLTRISVRPSEHPACYGTRLQGTYIDALSVEYDTAMWRQQFLSNWPKGSPAWQSYFLRIESGPAYTQARAAAF